MKIETTLAQMREDYNWQEAFSYAGKPESNKQGPTNPPARVLKATCSEERFGLEDVEEVLGSVDGEHEGAEWRAAVKLKDGRFAFVEAGCDYTGWDCRADGSAVVADSEAQLIRWGLTSEVRALFEVVAIEEG